MKYQNFHHEDQSQAPANDEHNYAWPESNNLNSLNVQNELNPSMKETKTIIQY